MAIVADNAKVTGFLGVGKRQAPFPKQAERVIKQTEEGVARTPQLSFEIGKAYE